MELLYGQAQQGGVGSSVQDLDRRHGYFVHRERARAPQEEADKDGGDAEFAHGARENENPEQDPEREDSRSGKEGRGPHAGLAGFVMRG